MSTLKSCDIDRVGCCVTFRVQTAKYAAMQCFESENYTVVKLVDIPNISFLLLTVGYPLSRTYTPMSKDQRLVVDHHIGGLV